jgi:hypothetical protein
LTSIVVSLLVSACVFVGGIVGLNLPRVLPRDHLTKETQDVVRLGTGMISVLASLVLGLLVATAKGSFDTTDQAVRAYAAEIALLNETLRDYGSGAARPHGTLRQYTEKLLQNRWPKNGEPMPVEMWNDMGGALLERVREEIRALKPVDDGQKWLLGQTLDISSTLLRQRWLLIEQSGTNIHSVVLVILVCWIVAIFISFGLNAPRNGTVVFAFLVCSIAIGGSIFLILELDRPLSGVIRISSWPVENALAQMNW